MKKILWKSIKKFNLIFSVAGTALIISPFLISGCSNSGGLPSQDNYRVTGNPTFSSSADSLTIYQTNNGFSTDDLTIDVSDNDYVKIENNNKLVWINNVRPFDDSTIVTISGFLGDYDENDFNVCLLAPQPNTYHISGPASLNYFQDYITISQTNNNVPTNDLTISVSGNEYVKIENNDKLVWNDDSRPDDDSVSVKVSGELNGIEQDSFIVALLPPEPHLNVVIDPFLSPIQAYYNKQGSYQFTARDNFGSSLTNPTWTILSGKIDSVTINNQGTLTWDQYALPGQYNMTIQCSCDPLTPATANIVLKVDSQPDYDVIPFSLLQVNNGVLETYGNISQYSKLVIPSGVTSIMNAAFKNCTSIKSVNFSDFNGLIGEEAFAGCTSLMTISFGKLFPNISNSAFKGCSSLLSLNLSNLTTQSIGASAFAGCTSLKYNNVTLPKSSNTYKSLNLPSSKILLNASGKTVGSLAFGSITWLQIKVPTNWSYIPEGAFFNCDSLISFDFSGFDGNIGISAFSGCTSLTYVNLSDLTTGSIGSSAFADCTSLSYNNLLLPSKSNLYTAVNGTTGKILLSNNSTRKVVGCLAVGSFLWSDIFTKTGWTSFPAGAFINCASLLSIDMTGMTGSSIGDGAFENCSSLTITPFPQNSSTVIDDYAFYNCTSISSVSLVGFSGTIASYAFANCTSLKTINLQNSTIQSIGSYAFAGCSSLVLSASNLPESNTNFTVFSSPNGVALFSSSSNEIAGCLISGSFTWTEIVSVTGWTSISTHFLQCAAITSLNLSASNSVITNHAFYLCASLKTVILSNLIGNISASAFADCINLTSINLNVLTTQTISANAFNGCVSLASIDLSGFSGSIGTSAFANCNSLNEIKINFDFVPQDWGTNIFTSISHLGVINNIGVLPSSNTFDFFRGEGLLSTFWTAV